MRIKLNQERLGVAGYYGASNTMTIALVTLYGMADIIKSYRTERRRFTAFLRDCCNTVPTDNPAQQRIRELCPQSKRIKLYISEWGLAEPSHYVILHRIAQTDKPDVFQLKCARLLRRLTDLDAMIDGITITWPSNNPEVACGQQAIIERRHMSGASVSVEVLESDELQRELRLSVETAQLYNNQSIVSVWGHPGKTVFEITSDDIKLVRVRPHAPNVSKFNVILWGDATNNALGDAHDLPRHIVPQIKGTTPYDPVDALETNMLRWALEARLIPYIAISHTTTRGDIFALTYEPESDEAFVTQIATNHKIIGLPRVLRIDNRGADVYVPDLALAERLKKLFFAGTHIYPIQQLIRTMGYKKWEDIPLAFENWGLPMSVEDEDRFMSMKVEQ